MIIAVDADGVCADLHSEWLRRYNRDFNDTLTPDQMTDWDLGKLVKPEAKDRIYEYLHDHDLYDYVRPLPGLQPVIEILRGDGHTIVIATTCTWGMAEQKARWFIRHGILPDTGRFLPDGFITIHDKTHLDADLLIDDSPTNIRRWVQDKRRRAVLFEYPYNLHLLDEMPSMFWQWCGRASGPDHWQKTLKYIERLLP